MSRTEDAKDLAMKLTSQTQTTSERLRTESLNFEASDDPYGSASLVMEEAAIEIERLTAALNEIIEWSEEYKHDDGTYETDRGDPGNIARAALV